MSTICECGCGDELPPTKRPRQTAVRFIPGHQARTRGSSQPGRRAYVPGPSEAPSGLCECGCGGRTGIVSHTLKSKRYFRGYPAPRLPGHGTQGRGAAHPNWKGGRVHTAGGYVMLHAPDHRDADKNGYVREHRIVMEGVLGRPIRPDEDVHHINGVRDDNRPENLVALTKQQHAEIHGPKRKFNSATMSAAGKKGAAVRWGKKP